MLTMTSAPASRCAAVGPEGVPDVLADVDAYVDAIDHEYRALGTGLEVAIFVEDAVVGQVDLVVNAQKLPVVGHGGGVVDVALGVDEADHHGYALGVGHNLPHPLDVGLDEGGLEQQVLRGVAGDCHLREDHDVGLLRPGLADVLQNPGGVAVQVADGGVDLGHGQT